MKNLTGRNSGQTLFSIWTIAAFSLFLGMTSASGWTQEKMVPAVTALAIAPDRSVLVGSQAGVSIRGIKSKNASILPVKLDHVLCMAFAPDGQTLAIGGGQAAEAGLVELWSWPEKKLRGRLDGHADLVHDLAWLPDGNTLATASADRTVRLWDVAKRSTKYILSGHSGPILSLAALPDGKSICSGSADQTIRVWNVTDGKLVRSLDNHLGAVNALAVRPGRAKDEPVTLASAGSDNTVRIWQPALGRQVRIVRHPAPVFAISWNREGSLLTSAGKDGTLRNIDGDSDQILQERLVSKGWVTSLCRPQDSDEIVAGTTVAGTTVGDIAGPGAGAKDKPVEVLAGPLKGLPSAAGAHAAKIQAMGNNTWLALGKPDADPKWGTAPGRSWCCTMPFAPELRGAFLYGEGRHGASKPDGHYLDDCWFYDLNAHRWVCIYPGTHVKEPGLKPNVDGFPTDKNGLLTPVSLCVHAYDLLTYDTDRHKLMIMGVHEYHFAPQALKALLPVSGKVPPSSPWHFDVKSGTWEVHKVDGPAPEKAEGTLLYVPSVKKAIYRSGNSNFVWFYDPAAKSWTRVSPKGPATPFRIDPTCCYDPKRDRIYLGGGSYPSVEPGKNALWIYDIKTDTWIDPQPKNTPISSYATNYATMRYDPVADVVILAVHADKRRGIYIYNPQTNAWNEEKLAFPDTFPRLCVNGFYDPEWNVHVFHAAGDSRTDGTIWLYRYQKAR